MFWQKPGGRVDVAVPPSPAATLATPRCLLSQFGLLEALPDGAVVGAGYFPGLGGGVPLRVFAWPLGRVLLDVWVPPTDGGVDPDSFRTSVAEGGPSVAESLSGLVSEAEGLPSWCGPDIDDAGFISVAVRRQNGTVHSWAGVAHLDGPAPSNWRQLSTLWLTVRRLAPAI